MTKDLGVMVITPAEMFEMIQDFADGLLNYMKKHGSTQEQNDLTHIVEASKQIMKIFQTLDISGRVAIITMLQGACAMYEIGVTAEQEHKQGTPPCPDLLN